MKKVTLDNIAAELGVTKNTVSKALRGQPGVSEQLRSKIIRLSDEYGYQKKTDQQAIKAQAPTQITLVINDSFTRDTFFTAAVLSGIFGYAASHQISIRNVIVDKERDDVKYLLALQEKYCDGILVIGIIPETVFTRIAGLNIPMVAVDHFSENVRCDYVNTANVDGILKALDFLAKNNHRRIGFINHVDAAYSFGQRYLGYRIGMERLGLSVDPDFVWPYAEYENNNYLRGQAEKFLARGDAPTAWVCVNDFTAYNFCSVLAERGMRVPEDVSVVGFDNIAGLYQPLTTMEIPQRDMGRRAVQRLMYRLKHLDEPFENIEIFTRLIDKGTVKCI